jgi:hypothetical protein
MLTRKQRLTKTTKRLSLMLRGRPGYARVLLVLGEMRSGTNMLAAALDRHPHVECYHENDEEAFRGYVLRSFEVADHLVRRSRAQWVVFKTIAEMGRATELLDHFADSRAIWIFRHFDDVVNSALRSFRQHNEYLRLVLEDEDGVDWRRWGLSEAHVALVRRHYERGISDASARGLIWYLRNRSFLDQDLLNQGRVLPMNYEDLVRTPHLQFKRMATFIGLLFHPRMCKGVFASSVRRDNPQPLDPAIRELCEELLTEMRGLTTEFAGAAATSVL